ncbi:MAG: hypothetical protein ACI97N_001542, partial [Cognaticolwellia sp.]
KIDILRLSFVLAFYSYSYFGSELIDSASRLVTLFSNNSSLHF